MGQQGGNQERVFYSFTVAGLRQVGRVSISVYGLGNGILDRYRTWLSLIAPHAGLRAAIFCSNVLAIALSPFLFDLRYMLVKARVCFL